MTDNEDVIRKLRDLARRKPISHEDLEKAKMYMMELRKNGFISREISELTGGAWSPPTVGNYITGVTVIDSSKKARIMALLAKMIDEDVGVKDVEDSIALREVLNSGNISLEEAASLLGEAKISGINASEMITMYKTIAKFMDLNELKQTLEYKARFESKNLSLDYLKKIFDTCDSYGGYEEVLQALEEYGSLATLKEVKKELFSAKSQLEAKVTSLKSQVSELSEKMEEVQTTLALFEKLIKKGLDTQALEELEKAHMKYGSIANVLAMIGQYSTMKDLDDEIDSLKGEKKSLEDQLGKVKEEKITLGSINSMCTKLNQELGYGVPDITSVYGAAAKFGQPNRILQAIMKYGELEAIQREVDGWKRVISQDKTQVGLLNKEIQELEAKRDLTMTQIKDGASGLQSQQDQALKFGEELKMARMYLAITKYPLELGRESVEYCTAILRSLAQMVRDAKLNRSYLIKDISDKNALPKYGSFVPYLNVELLDLLNWTERAIKESFMRAMLDSQGGKA